MQGAGSGGVKEGGVHLQASPKSFAVCSSFPSWCTHWLASVCESTSRWYGLSGSWGWSRRTSREPAYTTHVCSLLPGGDGNAAALRVDVVEANLTERARGSDTAATGMGLWHRFASFLSLTQLL